MRGTFMALLIGTLLLCTGCTNHDKYRFIGDTAPNQALTTTTGNTQG